MERDQARLAPGPARDRSPRGADGSGLPRARRPEEASPDGLLRGAARGSGGGRPEQSQQSAAQRALPLRHLRHREVERAGRGRGACRLRGARQDLQPALHPRRHRTRQDPPDAGHRAPGPQEAPQHPGALCRRGAVHQRGDRGHPRAHHARPPAPLPPGRRPLPGGRRALPRRARKRPRKSSFTRSTRCTKPAARSSSRRTGTRTRSRGSRSGW